MVNDLEIIRENDRVGVWRRFTREGNKKWDTGEFIGLS